MYLTFLAGLFQNAFASQEETGNIGECPS